MAPRILKYIILKYEFYYAGILQSKCSDNRVCAAICCNFTSLRRSLEQWQANAMRTKPMSSMVAPTIPTANAVRVIS